MTDIIGFNGAPRSGKTLAVAACARWYLQRGFKVLSNFRIYHKNAALIEPYDVVRLLQMGRGYHGRVPLFRNYVLCCQEIYGWLESRLGHDKAVLVMGYFILQSGKLGFSIVYDAQLNSSVDKRLKEVASARFEAEKKSDRFVYHELDLEETEKNVRTGKKKRISLDYAVRCLFPFYNTYDVSEPVGYDSLLMSMEKLDTARLERTVDLQVALILENRGLLLDCSKASVEYALLKLHQPSVFAGYVSTALRLRLR